MILSPIAAATPSWMARRRTLPCRLRTASAITTALSPDRMRSMNRTPINAPTKSRLKRSPTTHLSYSCPPLPPIEHARPIIRNSARDFGYVSLARTAVGTVLSQDFGAHVLSAVRRDDQGKACFGD